jgi:hypothetical protein
MSIVISRENACSAEPSIRYDILRISPSPSTQTSKGIEPAENCVCSCCIASRSSARASAGSSASARSRSSVPRKWVVVFPSRSSVPTSSTSEAPCRYANDCDGSFGPVPRSARLSYPGATASRSIDTQPLPSKAPDGAPIAASVEVAMYITPSARIICISKPSGRPGNASYRISIRIREPSEAPTAEPEPDSACPPIDIVIVKSMARASAASIWSAAAAITASGSTLWPPSCGRSDGAG